MRRVPRVRCVPAAPAVLCALFCTVYSVCCGLELVFAQVRGFFGAFLLYSGADLCRSIRSGGCFCSYTRMCRIEKNEVLG